MIFSWSVWKNAVPNYHQHATHIHAWNDASNFLGSSRAYGPFHLVYWWEAVYSGAPNQRSERSSVRIHDKTAAQRWRQSHTADSTSSKGHHCVAATWNTKLHWTGTLTSKRTRPQSIWLQKLGSNTGTRLPDSNTEHRRVEVAPHRCVGRVEAECQSYWTVAAKAENLCPSEGTSLRTSY